MATKNCDDPFKKQGQLTFKIEKLEEFARQPPGTKRVSSAIYVQGLPWQIVAVNEEKKEILEYDVYDQPHSYKLDHRQKCISFYVQCNGGNKDPSWSCYGSFTLIRVAPNRESENLTDQIKHDFGANRNCHACDISFDDLTDGRYEWYDRRTDSLILKAHIRANYPCGIKPGDLGLSGSDGDIQEQWAQHFLGRISSMSKTSKFSDCVIEVGKKEFNVHKLVLASNSDVFGAMFANNGVKESRESRVQIGDSSERAIGQMLHFMYTGVLPADFKAGDAPALFGIAKKYQIEPLAEISAKRLLESISLDTVLDVLELAYLHELEAAKCACHRFIRENINEIKQNKKWMALKETDPGLLLAIIEEI